MTRTLITLAASAMLATPLVSALASNQHATDSVSINAQQQKAAHIVVKPLSTKTLPEVVSAPCEVIPNVALSAIVSPRIKAQVLKRFAYVGDEVKKGEPLLVLSSVEMATAQSNLLAAAQEWHRYQRLGKKFVAIKTYRLAEIKFQHAYSKLIAYGMTKKQVNAFLKNKNPTAAVGDFTVLAPKTGTILSAKFMEGETIQPGQAMMRIVNEKTLWADARLSRSDSEKVKKGDPVALKFSDKKIVGKVIRLHHQLEPTTRRLIARIEVPNLKDQLHPGQFVDCRIQTAHTQPLLTVPREALMRTPDGDLAVYVENKPGTFTPVHVTVTKSLDGFAAIQGIKAGTPVVMEGAFFVHSELLKSGFSTHHH